MKTSKLFFWCCLFAVAALLTVRPAHASGTVTGTISTSAALSGGCRVTWNTYTATSGTCQASCSSIASQGSAAVAPNHLVVDPATSSSACYLDNVNPQGAIVGYPTGVNTTTPVLYCTTGSLSGSSCLTTTACPGNATLASGSCTCDSAYSPNGNAMSCIIPVYQGSAAISVCTNDGLCSANTYSSESLACASFATGLDVSPTTTAVLPGHICKVDQYYSDGSHQVTYRALITANICASGDTACTTAVSVEATAAAVGVYASNVSATTTQAASNAQAAAIAAGASAASAVQISQQAAGQVAANMAPGAGGQSSAPVDYAKTGEANAAANKINSKLDQVKAAIQAQSGVSISSTVAAVSGSSLPSNTNGSWYVKSYPNGIGGVMVSNFNIMKTTPLYGLINNIIPTISGAAHSGCFTINVWQHGNQSVCIPDGVLSLVGICIMMTALFASRGLIFGG